jgi:hypothetical protein
MAKRTRRQHYVAQFHFSGFTQPSDERRTEMLWLLPSCQRNPKPVFLKWKGLEASPAGDFFVRSGPGTVKLPVDSAKEFIRTRFPSFGGEVPRSETGAV